jgi:excisionase family DNA binding protein
MSILKKLRERAEPMNVGEVAKLFSVTAGTVQKWTRLKQIPCIRIGDTIRFDATMLADWIEAQAACPHPPRGPENPDADPLHWQDLEEIVPEEFRRSAIRHRKEPQ